MAVFTALIETLAALGISGAVAYLVGATYVGISAFVFVVCWLLLLDVAHRKGEVLEQPVGFGETSEAAVVALILAVIWPSIPAILFARGGADQR